MLNIEYWSITKKGDKHPKNEDNSLCINEMNIFGTAIFLICDGVGGYAGGDIASHKIVTKFERRFHSLRINPQNIEEYIMKTIDDANSDIVEYSQTNLAYSQLSSTLVGLFIINDTYHAFSVGDSRIYLRDKIGFRQINEDDSKVWERYKEGLIKKSEIIKQDDKNIITAALGFKNKVNPHYYKGQVNDYFQFLLSSDGLTDFVTEGDIEKHLSEGKSVREKCVGLLEKAIKNGSDDDITITLIEGDRNKIKWSQ
ncbi:serine/threonine-protein phosphatase [bacterium]|nr:serine/threonine-protein phosphatase [bacterium]